MCVHVCVCKNVRALVLVHAHQPTFQLSSSSAFSHWKGQILTGQVGTLEDTIEAKKEGGIERKRKKAKTAVAPLEKGCLVAAH